MLLQPLVRSDLTLCDCFLLQRHHVCFIKWISARQRNRLETLIAHTTRTAIYIAYDKLTARKTHSIVHFCFHWVLKVERRIAAESACIWNFFWSRFLIQISPNMSCSGLCLQWLATCVKGMVTVSIKAVSPSVRPSRLWRRYTESRFLHADCFLDRSDRYWRFWRMQ